MLGTILNVAIVAAVLLSMILRVRFSFLVSACPIRMICFLSFYLHLIHILPDCSHVAKANQYRLGSPVAIVTNREKLTEAQADTESAKGPAE